MLCDIYNPIAVENGQRFNIREGGRTVGYPTIRIQGMAFGVIPENHTPAYSYAHMFPWKGNADSKPSLGGHRPSHKNHQMNNRIPRDWYRRGCVTRDVLRETSGVHRVVNRSR